MSTSGPRILLAFLREHELTNVDCARALGISPVAIHHWMDGVQRPREPHRRAIEIWTRGHVPVSVWLTKEERAEITAVKPFKDCEAAPPPVSKNKRKPRRSRVAA